MSVMDMEHALLTTEALDALGTHPFPRLMKLLEGASSPPGLEPIDLSIGEPQVAPPSWLAEQLLARKETLRTYPTNAGPRWFADAVLGWLERRFNIPHGVLDHGSVVPTAGAREALFQLGLAIRQPSSGRDLIAMPTPHYAPYRAAAVFGRFSPLRLAATQATGYLPDLAAIPPELSCRIAMLYICSPSNPEGAVASRLYLAQAIEYARSRGFLLVVDECYSEIYRQLPPPSVLEVCAELGGGGDPFRNVVVVNSLSKRSSAAGLRVGWVAGDRRVVSALVGVRAFAGGTTPLVNLHAGAALYNDEKHVDKIRSWYQDSFAAADEVLGQFPNYHSPEAGMFLWLPVDNDEDSARRVWEQAALRVVPGSYLGPADDAGIHPGRSHIRVAMVHHRSHVTDALSRLREVLAAGEERNEHV
jgi:aspartate/methionine/tyrosine aminotransferase